MFYYLLIGLFTISFIYELFLNVLEIRSSKRVIPDNVSDVYDNDTYLKWINYNHDKKRIDLIECIVSFIIMLLLLIFKVFSRIVVIFPDNYYNQALGVLLFYIGVTTLINIIFSYIKTFKVEQKYGFNKSNIGLFIKDTIISLIFELGLTIGITFLFIASLNALGYLGLLIAFLVVIFVMFFVFMFNRKFLRLFNKFEKLPDGELRDKLIELLNKNGYSVREIEVMNASKRTTKSNAMFTGIGKFKTIILYDNLLNELTSDEIVAVFSHELGHGKHKDTIKGFIRSIVMISLLVGVIFLLTLFDNIYLDNGFNTINYGFGVVILSEGILSFFSPLLSFITNFFSRKQEYAADSFACDEGYGELLISSLKKLARSNFSNLNPDPLVVKLTYSHPTLSERIDNIRKVN